MKPHQAFTKSGLRKARQLGWQGMVYPHASAYTWECQSRVEGMNEQCNAQGGGPLSGTARSTPLSERWSTHLQLFFWLATGFANAASEQRDAEKLYLPADSLKIVR